MRRRARSGLVSVVLTAMMADVAAAVDKTFVGTPAMTSWLEDMNWLPIGVPGDADDVTLDSSRSAELSGSASIRDFTLDTGELTGTGTLTVLGRLHWIDGAMRGTFLGDVGTTNVEMGMDLPSPGPSRQIDGRILNVNGGTSTVTGAGGLGVNNGTLNLDDDALLEFTGDGGGQQFITGSNGIVNVGGTLRRAADNTGVMSIQNIEVNNLGNIEILAGRAEIGTQGRAENGSTYTIADGAELQFATTFGYDLQAGSLVTGAGKVEIFGEVTAGGTWNVATTEITAGSLSFTVPATLVNLILTGNQGAQLGGEAVVTITGSLEWSGGDMVGAGVTNAENGMEISGSSNGIAGGRTVNLNGGTGRMNGARVDFEGGTFNNNAVFEVVQGSTTNRFRAFTGGSQFNNAGTFRALQSVNFEAVPFANSGTVEIGPNVFMSASAYTQTAGTTRLGANSSMTSPAIELGENGMLEGLGTIQSLTGAGFATVVNAGTASPGLAVATLDGGGAVLPGPATGRLFINANYMQTPTGRLKVEIGGRKPYAEYDALESSAEVALGGALDVSLINGFLPDPGDMFVVVFGASRSGDFDSENGLVIGNGLGFRVQLGGRDVVLETVFEDCDDDKDNDGDGDADCNDPKCAGAPECSGTPVASATASAMATATPTPTGTATATPTSTPTPTGPTRTRTATFTFGPSPTATETRDPSLPTLTPTSTPTGTETPTFTRTPTPTGPTRTRTATFTFGPSPTATETRDPSLPTLTPTATPTDTPTDTPTPTATATTVPFCTGDCNEDDEVTIDELLRAVKLALEGAPSSACPPGDPDGDGRVRVNEVIRAVRNAQSGCRPRR